MCRDESRKHLGLVHSRVQTSTVRIGGRGGDRVGPPPTNVALEISSGVMNFALMTVDITGRFSDRG